jgi:hypothetical protein
MIMMMKNLVEWWLARETEVPGENLSQCHFVHHKPRMLCLHANPARRDGKPATNRSSYGTAFLIDVFLTEKGAQLWISEDGPVNTVYSYCDGRCVKRRYSLNLFEI